MTASSSPLSSKFDLLQQRFATLNLDHAVSTVSLQELSLSIETSDLINVMTFFYDEPELAFKQLVDICAVDYIDRPKRFDVVYHLLSHYLNVRVRIKVAVSEQDAVPTAVYLYSAANWYEREVFDLYGITFKGHPDLRRLLTDYNFQGHPMRKDFPLTGYVEPAYDPVQKKVIYNPVILPQEYRDFDFTSPWQGMTPSSPVTLPGDEKAHLNP